AGRPCAKRRPRCPPDGDRRDSAAHRARRDRRPPRSITESLTMINRRSVGAGLFTGLLAPKVFAQATDWPSRNVRIVCPFTPGGSQDLIARRLGVKLGEQFGQSFVVDNRSGAGGSIAADNVAKSPPDGYAVLLGNIGSHALVPHLYAKPPFDAFKDL